MRRCSVIAKLHSLQRQAAETCQKGQLFVPVTGGSPQNRISALSFREYPPSALSLQFSKNCCLFNVTSITADEVIPSLMTGSHSHADSKMRHVPIVDIFMYLLLNHNDHCYHDPNASMKHHHVCSSQAIFTSFHDTRGHIIHTAISIASSTVTSLPPKHRTLPTSKTCLQCDESRAYPKKRDP